MSIPYFCQNFLANGEHKKEYWNLVVGIFGQHRIIRLWHPGALGIPDAYYAFCLYFVCEGVGYNLMQNLC